MCGERVRGVNGSEDFEGAGKPWDRRCILRRTTATSLLGRGFELLRKGGGSVNDYEDAGYRKDVQ